MKKILLFLLITLPFLSCQDDTPQIAQEKSSIEKNIQSNETIATLGEYRTKTYPGTLEEIKKRKFIRILTTNNSFNYFVHSGTQKGFVSYLNEKLGLRKKGINPF